MTLRRKLLRRAGLPALLGTIALGLAAAPPPAASAMTDTAVIDTPPPAHVVQEGPRRVTLRDLEVERKTEPVGIDVERPRFSWTIDTRRRGTVQQGYLLRVATSPEALDSGDLVWNSGMVPSDASWDVSYGGPELDPATDYYWRVLVRTSAGVAMADSTFRTGLYDDGDWAGSTWIGNERSTSDLSLDDARWIWTPESTAPQAPPDPRAFRTTRTTPDGREASTAEILITGDDSFRLWVNGDLVGGTEGAENEWQTGHRYEVELAGDRNVFAVRTTNTPHADGTDSPAGLLAAVRIHYDDGSTDDLVTDTGWLASRTVPDGFEEPGFDDSAWQPAVVQAPYGSGPWGRGVSVQQPVAPAPLLRKEFDVRGEVADATLFVAAGGYANASLNGEPVSDDVLSPGFTDYDDTVQYVADDVTSHLTDGTNALGFELGRGFYGMTGSNVWNWHDPPWHDEPVVRAVLRIEYADGGVDTVVTDGTWTVHDGPTLFDDLYGGETYDAALAQDDFDTAGFDASGWDAATEADGPRGELVNQRQQPVRVTESLPATEITEPAEHTYVVKFPRVLAGWVELTAAGSAGTEIEAVYGEKLHADGTVSQAGNAGFGSGFQTDRFLLAGTGAPETWEPRFSYKGFQYVQISGWPGEGPPPPEAFTAKAVHTDAAETGSFDSSSRIMNATHRAVVDTLANNIHSVPTDTPMFEKNGWTGDAVLGADMFLLNLDTHELFAKWIRDVHESRDENGAPLVIAPSSADWGQWGPAQPWHSAYVLIPDRLYRYGGDRQVVRQYYDGMKRYVDLEFDRSDDGLVTDNRLGDWVSPDASPGGGNAPEDSRVSGTAFLHTMLTTMSRTADLLDKPGDATRFTARAEIVRKAFNDAYLDREQGFYRGQTDESGYRQTHNVLALAFGLAPDARTAQRVADSIAADVTERGTTLNTGVLGTKFLLPVLTEHGYPDLAYDLAVQTEYPSWGYMVENGATSMWEHWSPEARSLGHYFLGTVDDWFYQYVAGIRPSAEHGFRRTTVAPVLAEELDHASATAPTPFGPVRSAWERSGTQVRMDVSVPVGMRATVRLPTAVQQRATESGSALETAAGVESVEVANGSVHVVVGSGDYVFDVAGATVSRTQAARGGTTSG
ncbi:glycoside hydrolase family 78 protein [Myceligenerans cantabricum]